MYITSFTSDGPKSLQVLVKDVSEGGFAFYTKEEFDDILDVEGSQEIVGKTLKKDKEQNKLTFVGCYGIDKAKIMARTLIDEAKDIVSIFNDKAQNLQRLADFIINRKY